MKEIKEFAQGFLKAMDNRFLGHSLKKWLAVGIYWLIVVLCLRYTDASNLEVVLGILSGLMLTLMGLNVADKKVNTPSSIIEITKSETQTDNTSKTQTDTKATKTTKDENENPEI